MGAAGTYACRMGARGTGGGVATPRPLASVVAPPREDTSSSSSMSGESGRPSRGPGAGTSWGVGRGLQMRRGPVDVWRQHRGEDVARAGLRLAQEGFFLIVATGPRLDHDDGVAIRELEPANVDRVAEGVLG